MVMIETGGNDCMQESGEASNGAWRGKKLEVP